MSEIVFNPLKNYIQIKKISLRAFSRVVKIPVSTLHRIYYGGKPSKKTASRICKYTQGEILLKDFGYE